MLKELEHGDRSGSSARQARGLSGRHRDLDGRGGASPRGEPEPGAALTIASYPKPDEASPGRLRAACREPTAGSCAGLPGAASLWIFEAA